MPGRGNAFYSDKQCGMCIRSSLPEGDSRTGFPSAGCRPAVRSVPPSPKAMAGQASLRARRQPPRIVIPSKVFLQFREKTALFCPIKIAVRRKKEKLPYACCAFSATICATPAARFPPRAVSSRRARAPAAALKIIRTAPNPPIDLRCGAIDCIWQRGQCGTKSRL